MVPWSLSQRLVVVLICLVCAGLSVIDSTLSVYTRTMADSLYASLQNNISYIEKSWLAYTHSVVAYEEVVAELTATKKKLAEYTLLSKDAQLLRYENTCLKHISAQADPSSTVHFFDPPYLIQRDKIKQAVLLPNYHGTINLGAFVQHGNKLVGRISHINKNSVRVQLVTDRKSAIPVTIKDKSISGILYGRNSSAMRLKLVKDNSNVQVGDVVQTKKVPGFLEKTIRIGTVSSVNSIPGDSFLFIEVLPDFSLDYNTWLHAEL